MSIEKKLLSGNTDMMILQLLSKSDLYGYQITKNLSEQSDHLFELKEGTLYPLLHQMEKKGYVVSYNRISEIGKERRYYSITDSGTKYLAARKEYWKLYALTINSIMES